MYLAAIATASYKPWSWHEVVGLRRYGGRARYGEGAGRGAGAGAGARAGRPRPSAPAPRQRAALAAQPAQEDRSVQRRQGDRPTRCSGNAYHFTLPVWYSTSSRETSNISNHKLIWNIWIGFDKIPSHYIHPGSVRNSSSLPQSHMVTDVSTFIEYKPLFDFFLSYLKSCLIDPQYGIAALCSYSSSSMTTSSDTHSETLFSVIQHQRSKNITLTF